MYQKSLNILKEGYAEASDEYEQKFRMQADEFIET
jgi:hypothetical protein